MSLLLLLLFLLLLFLSQFLLLFLLFLLLLMQLTRLRSRYCRRMESSFAQRSARRIARALYGRGEHRGCHRAVARLRHVSAGSDWSEIIMKVRYGRVRHTYEGDDQYSLRAQELGVRPERRPHGAGRGTRSGCAP